MPTDSHADLVAVLLALAKALTTAEAGSSSDQHGDARPPGGTVDGIEPALIPVPEAAKVLGISRASAYRYAAAGHLPIKRFGRRMYVIRARLADVTIPDQITAPEADAA